MSAPSWQQPPCMLLLFSTLARNVCALVATTASRAVIIINTRPRCLRPCGNDCLVDYYYKKSSLAMTAPLWQRPPSVPLLLSTLARDVCALVATTASRAIIIFKARPDDCALVAKTPSRAHIIINARPGLLRSSGTDCLACQITLAWSVHTTAG